MPFAVFMLLCLAEKSDQRRLLHIFCSAENHSFLRLTLEIDRYIGRYLGFTGISVSAKTAHIIGLSRCWQNAVIFLTLPDIFRKKAQRSKSIIILQQRLQVRFHKQADKINHGACVGRRSRNKSTMEKFRSAWSYRVHVLCTNELPLYFRKFSQHETFWL